MHSRQQQIERDQSYPSDNTSSCGGSGRSSTLDDLLFSDLAEDNDTETLPPIRKPSRRAPSSIKRSLQERRESWVCCDWEVIEKECYSDSSSDEETGEEDADKLVPLFDDEDEKETATLDHAIKQPLTRRGSLHEVILNEDSPVISGCARPKMRRRGTMEERITQDGQKQPP